MHRNPAVHMLLLLTNELGLRREAAVVLRHRVRWHLSRWCVSRSIVLWRNAGAHIRVSMQWLLLLLLLCHRCLMQSTNLRHLNRWLAPMTYHSRWRAFPSGERLRPALLRLLPRPSVLLLSLLLIFLLLRGIIVGAARCRFRRSEGALATMA